MANLSSRLILSLVDRVSGPARRINGTMNRMNRMNRRGRGFGAGMFAGFAGRAAAMVGGLYAVKKAYDGTVGASMNFSESFSEVRKVVDGSPYQLEKLRKGLLNLSKATPTNASSLTNILAEAGQAGIAKKNLLEFTKFADRAGIAFDMNSREVGSIFAKLKNVYKLDMEGMKRVGDAANVLSNKMAAKGSEILDFTNRAAGAAVILNLLPRQLSAIGASLIASGIKSETAARGLNSFSANMANGGPKVEKAFKQIGLSFKAWKKLQGKDGPAAMVQLFKLMQKSPKGIKSLISLFGKDFSDDFVKLFKNPEMLEKALNLVRDPIEIKGSVDAEFINKMDTPLNKIKMMRNNFAALGIEFGSKIAKPLGDAAKKIGDWLATLETRVTVFDHIGEAMQGFWKGLGFKGDIGPLEALLKAFTTTKDVEKGADNLAKTFMKFQAAGDAVKHFADQVARMIKAVKDLTDNPASKWWAEFAEKQDAKNPAHAAAMAKIKAARRGDVENRKAAVLSRKNNYGRSSFYSSPAASRAKDEASGHHRTNGGQATLQRLKEIQAEKAKVEQPVTSVIDFNIEPARAKLNTLKKELQGLNSYFNSSFGQSSSGAFSDGVE